MKLTNKHTGKYSSMKEFYSDLTTELDRLAGLSKESIWKHYILANDYCMKDRCLAIRIPGGTVGGIWIDENNIITIISIDTDYVVKTYTSDVNERIQKFMGEKIEF